MSQAAEQFSYQELNNIAVIIQVDMRVAQTLGLEISDEDKKLLEKVQRLIENFDFSTNSTMEGKT